MSSHARRLSTLLIAVLVAAAAPSIARAQIGGGEGPSDLQDPSRLPDGIGLYDCNPQHVLCDAIEPKCFAAGWVPRVVSGCWGECVEFSQCEPIICSGNDQCPGGSTFCHERGFCSSGDCNILLEFPPVCDDDGIWIQMQQAAP